MPMYDRRCAKCGIVHEDCWEPIKAEDPGCSSCGGTMERVFLPTGRGQVIGDECDVMMKHAICNPDGTPKRFTSKAEIKRAAERAGYTNAVTHIGAKGSDKSKHTTRWT